MLSLTIENVLCNFEEVAFVMHAFEFVDSDSYNIDVFLFNLVFHLFLHSKSEVDVM